MRWPEWRGSFDGRPSMFIRNIFGAFGCKVDLHKFVRADDLGCFHTHPAWAVRIVLWGGYVEELGDRYRETTYAPRFREVRPFTIGLVEPYLEHRIHALRNGRSSYSIWLRGPKVAAIAVRGC